MRLAQLQDAGSLPRRAVRAGEGVLCTRMRETVRWARELFGGNGIVLDYNVGRFVADAEALYSYEGTREMQDADRREVRHRPERVRLRR